MINIKERMDRRGPVTFVGVLMQVLRWLLLKRNPEGGVTLCHPLLRPLAWLPIALKCLFTFLSIKARFRGHCYSLLFCLLWCKTTNKGNLMWIHHRATELAQWIIVLAAFPENSSSVLAPISSSQQPSVRSWGSNTSGFRGHRSYINIPMCRHVQLHLIQNNKN